MSKDDEALNEHNRNSVRRLRELKLNSLENFIEDAEANDDSEAMTGMLLEFSRLAACIVVKTGYPEDNFINVIIKGMLRNERKHKEQPDARIQ